MATGRRHRRNCCVAQHAAPARGTCTQPYTMARGLKCAHACWDKSRCPSACYVVPKCDVFCPRLAIISFARMQTLSSPSSSSLAIRYLDGVREASGRSVGTGGLDGLRVGCDHTSTFYLKGAIAELRLFSCHLSEPSRSQIEAALALR